MLTDNRVCGRLAEGRRLRRRHKETPAKIMSTDADIEELQAKLALAEDLLDTLNTTVWRQQQRIERLEEDVRMLRRWAQESTPATDGAPKDEIPPHW